MVLLYQRCWWRSSLCRELWRLLCTTTVVSLQPADLFKVLYHLCCSLHLVVSFPWKRIEPDERGLKVRIRATQQCGLLAEWDALTEEVVLQPVDVVPLRAWASPFYRLWRSVHTEGIMHLFPHLSFESLSPQISAVTDFAPHFRGVWGLNVHRQQPWATPCNASLAPNQSSHQQLIYIHSEALPL